MHTFSAEFIRDAMRSESGRATDPYNSVGKHIVERINASGQHIRIRNERDANRAIAAEVRRLPIPRRER